MTIKKLDDGRYLVAVRPDGREGKYIRRIVEGRSRALRLERELLDTTFSDMDSAKLSVLAQYWFDHFGVNLKDGKARKAKIDNVIASIGDKKYSVFKPAHFLSYRRRRLEANVSKNTCNHDLAYVKTVFNKLVKLGCLTRNVLADIEPLKFDEYEFAYLSLYQIKKLLVAARNSRNESLYPVVVTLLSTGARWSEVESLQFNQLFNQSLRFSKTKSLKSRTVPISTELYDYLMSRKPLSIGGRVFANCYDAFTNALRKTKVELPKGQRSHVLRHSFASHFVIDGGDIFTLQKILGHSDPRVTMRYAHLAPDHLQDAVHRNPITQIGLE